MSEKIEYTSKLTRISSEIRFRPTLDSWKAVIDAAQELEDSYQEWQIKESKPDDILLFSPDKKASIRVCYNRILYSKESDESLDEMNNQMETAFNTIGVKSKVKDIAHIGFRRIAVYETKLKFEELSDVIYSAFYKKDEINELPFAVDDLQIVIDGKSTQRKIGNHLRFGPMENEQAWRVFDSPFEQVNNLNENKAFLFLDVDSFSKSKLKLDEVLPEKQKCIENNVVVTESIIEKLSV